MDSDKTIRVGKEAQSVLNNPLMVDFFENEPQRIYAQWANCEDDDMAKELRLYAKAIKQLHKRLRSYVAIGNREEARQNGESTESASII